MLATPIEKLNVVVYRVPTDSPESDGTFKWDATTMVLVEVTAGNRTGLGYTYSSQAAGTLIEEQLKKLVLGRDALDIPAIWEDMAHAVRNLGRPGIASSAISAVDIALWDLKARLLDLPLARLLGVVRPAVPAYGSGGFTSYSRDQLQFQLRRWAEEGFSMVKMKVGRHPEQDLDRMAAAREAIGPNVRLFVDANGAFTLKKAVAFAWAALEYQVTWFEEPLPSTELEGLADIRRHGPPGIDIAGGEYGYEAAWFYHTLEAQAVDVLQADITRCGGLSELQRVAGLCAAREIPLSTHTAPSLHTHPGCALAPIIHAEYFHDHALIEQMFFDGAPRPEEGCLRPDLSRPGFGLEFKRRDARKYLVL